VLREKFIAISAQIFFKKRSQMNNLMIYLKPLEKQNKTNQKLVGRIKRDWGRN
jgi:hypothetical protein